MPRLATLEKKHAAITGIGDDMVRYKPPTKKSLAGAIQEGFDRARAVAAVADTTPEQGGRRKQVEATPEAPCLSSFWSALASSTACPTLSSNGMRFAL